MGGIGEELTPRYTRGLGEPLGGVRLSEATGVGDELLDKARRRASRSSFNSGSCGTARTGVKISLNFSGESKGESDEIDGLGDFNLMRRVGEFSVGSRKSSSSPPGSEADDESWAETS